MLRYSVPEHISLVKVYYERTITIAAQRKFVTEYKLNTTGPSVLIKILILKFDRTGSVCDRQRWQFWSTNKCENA